MKVFIKTLSGRTLSLEVSPNQPVETLKNLISEREGIPSHQQRLVHGGRPLENGTTLQDCKVTDGGTIHLIRNDKRAGETMRLFVKSLTGKTITVEVDQAATVANVKEKITQLEGVPAHMQQLIFSGVSLADDRVLSTYNIQRESTVHLVVKVPAGDTSKTVRTGGVEPLPEQHESRRPYSAQHPTSPVVHHPVPAPRNYSLSSQGGYSPEPLRTPKLPGYAPPHGDPAHNQPQYALHPGDPAHNQPQIEVVINNLSGKQLTLTTNPYNLVSALKEELAVKEGYGKDQFVLLFNGRNLPENRSLNSCGITDHSVLSLMFTPNQQRMHLFVKTLTGQTFILYPLSTNTVREVKEDIERREGIPSSQQKLVFEGQSLEDDITLKENRLPLQCTVHLIHQAPVAQPLTILVRTLLGKTIALHINSGDSVRSVKRQIQEKEGYPPDQISLVFGGREMDDDATLTQYSVQQDSTLLVSFRTKAALRLMIVSQSTGEVININSLYPNDTVQALFGALQRQKQVHMETHRLVFHGKILTGQRSLGDCGLQDGSTVELYHGHPSSVCVDIITVAGVRFSLQVSTSEAVRTIKTQLQEKTSVPADELILMHGNTVMEDGRVVSSYSLSEKTSLWLFSVPYGQRRLTIVTHSGRIPVDIVNGDTIGQLKVVLQRKDGTAAYHQDLRYNGVQLQDHFCIGDYVIPDQALVHMSAHSSPLCLVHFMSSIDSSSFTLLVGPNDAVAVIELRVAAKLGIPVEKVRLVLCGEVLDSNQSISYYKLTFPSLLLVVVNQ